jgi:hypothetical protein
MGRTDIGDEVFPLAANDGHLPPPGMQTSGPGHRQDRVMQGRVSSCPPSSPR